MLTLFIVASLEGWPDIMYQAIDVTKKDNGPKYEDSPAQSVFFVVFFPSVVVHRVVVVRKTSNGATVRL